MQSMKLLNETVEAIVLSIQREYGVRVKHI
jgi:hypothetical protein